MPGGDNTIALLSNIVKKLDIITDAVVRSADPNNQRMEAEQNLINNRTTGLNSAKPIESPNVEQRRVEASIINPNNDISIKNIISFLDSLPATVKNVTKLSGGEIKRFETVLTKISSSIINFAKNGNIDSLSKDAVDKYKAATDLISGLGSSIKQIALLAPIIPLFSLSLALLMPSTVLLGKMSEHLAKFKDAKDALDGIKVITDMIKSFGTVVVSIIAMGLAIKLIGTESILAGVGVVMGVIVAMSALSIGILAMSSLIKSSTEGLSDITKFVAGMIALTAATLLMGAIVTSKFDVMMSGLAAVGTIIVSYTVLSFAVAAAGSIMGVLDKAKSFESIMKFMIGAVLITAATIGLSYLANTISFEQVAITFGLISGVLLLSVGVALLMQAVKSPIENGIKALVPIGQFMILSAGVLLASMILIKVKEGFGIEWGEVLGTFGMMTLVIVAMGGLAAAAGSAQSLISKGLPALTLCTLLSAGMTLVLGGIISATNTAKSNLGEKWGVEILKSIGLMGLVVTEFGVLAGLAGALIIPIGLGIPALASVELLAAGAILVVKKIVDLQLYMNEAKLDEVKIRGTVSTITAIVNDLVKMVTDISFSNERSGLFGKLGAGFSVVGKSAVLGILMGSVALITKSISSIAEIVTPDGKLIRPSHVVDGQLVSGDPVDIIAAGKTVIAVIRDFSSLITEEFSNLGMREMLRANIAMRSIASMLDPISNFTRALMAFDSSNGTTLCTVTITPDGKVVKGPAINTVTVANMIASAIGKFAETLFSEENSVIWKRMTEGRGLFRKSDNEKAMGILSTVIEPVVSFVEVMSKFGTNGDNLTVADATGKTKSINLSAIGKGIAQGVTAFVTEIAGIRINQDSMYNANVLTNILKTSLEPVNKFVSMLIPYADSPSGMLPEFDATGKKIRDINVVTTAENISSAAKLFAASITELQNGMIVDHSKVSMSSSVMTKYINNLLKVTGGRADKQLQGFATTIKSDTKSLQDFDNVLNNGNKKRIENINNLADAVEMLGKRIVDSEEGLHTLVSIFESLNGIDPDRIRRGITEAMRIGQLDKKDAKAIADLQGAFGTSDESIENAIKNALTDISIRVPNIEINSFGQGTGRPGYEIDGVDLSFK